MLWCGMVWQGSPVYACVLGLPSSSICTCCPLRQAPCQRRALL